MSITGTGLNHTCLDSFKMNAAHEVAGGQQP